MEFLVTFCSVPNPNCYGEGMRERLLFLVWDISTMSLTERSENLFIFFKVLFKYFIPKLKMVVQIINI